MKVFRLKTSIPELDYVSNRFFIDEKDLDQFIERLNYGKERERKVFRFPNSADNNLYMMIYENDKLKECMICGSIASFDLMIVSKYISKIEVFKSSKYIHTPAYLECRSERKYINPAQQQYMLYIKRFKLHDITAFADEAFYANIDLMITSNNFDLNEFLENSVLDTYIIGALEDRGLAKHILQYYVEKGKEGVYTTRREYIVPIIS